MANIVTRMQFSEVFDQLHNLVAGKGNINICDTKSYVRFAKNLEK